jgi:hypothetical protein
MTIFRWIIAAPSLIGKIQRAINTAQMKNWTTTAAVLVALIAEFAGIFGFPLTPEVVHGIQSVALFIVGLFTGVQVVNPEKVDAEWKVMANAGIEKK